MKKLVETKNNIRKQYLYFLRACFDKPIYFSLFISCLLISPIFASVDAYLHETDAAKNVRLHLGDIVKDWALAYAKEKDLTLKWYDLEARNKSMSTKEAYKDKKITQHKAVIKYDGSQTDKIIDAAFKEYSTWVHNGGTVRQTPSANLKEETQSTTSWTLGDSTKLGIQITASAEVPFGGFELGVNSEFEFHEERTLTKARIQSWEIQGPVQTPASTSMKLWLTILEKESTKPFTLVADIQGHFAIKLTGGLFKRGKGIKVFPISKIFSAARRHDGYKLIKDKVRVKIKGAAKSQFGICGSLRYLQYPYLNCLNGQEEDYLRSHPNIKEASSLSQPVLIPKDGGQIASEDELYFVQGESREYMCRSGLDSDSDEDISIEANDE